MLKKLILPLIFTASASAMVSRPLSVLPMEQLEPVEEEIPSYVFAPQTGAELIDYLQPGQKAALVVFCTPQEPLCSAQMDDALEVVAKSRRAQVNVIKVDANKHAALARFYRVDKLPHFLLFRDGIGLGRTYGVTTGSELRDWIDERIFPQLQQRKSPQNAP